MSIEKHMKKAYKFKFDAPVQEIILYANNQREVIRIDATENNKEQILKFLNGEIERMHFDEYVDTKTDEALREVFSIADAICV